jgi:hypothetical protein
MPATPELETINLRELLRNVSAWARPVDLFSGTNLQQCCGSRMFIPDPDFFLFPDPGSWIPNIGSWIPDQQKKRGGHKFHKIINYSILNRFRERF